VVSRREEAAAVDDERADGRADERADERDGGLAAPCVPRLRIGEVAALTGASERALRYYEEIGLLSPAGHSKGGSRRYTEAEVARVRRIRELQELMGLNLDEIRAVIANEDRLEALRAAWLANDAPAQRREILLEGLAIVDDLAGRVRAKTQRLSAFLAELEARAARYRELLERWSAPAPTDRGGG
jgi:DNA-binding transcriptional MerR regulator